MNTQDHPRGVGIGLRRALMDALRAELPAEVRWLEVAPENYVRRGGAMRAGLDALRAHYPMVTHGLTMSLGGDEPLDARYLAEVRDFARAVGSPWHSDHLCMSAHGGAVLHDLLPIPHTSERAARVVENLLRARDALGMAVAAENISYYARPGVDAMTEAAFISEVLERADAGLLLDVNNVYVNACNHGFDAEALIAALPLHRVVQIHVAGHRVEPDGFRIDTHGAPIADPVLDLLAFTLALTGPVPVLLERDQEIPALSELLGEVRALTEIWERAAAAWTGRAA